MTIGNLLSAMKGLQVLDEIDDLVCKMEVVKVIPQEEEYRILLSNVIRKSKPFIYSDSDYQSDIIRYKRYLELEGEDELLDIHLKKFLSSGGDKEGKAEISKQIDDYIFELVRE